MTSHRRALLLVAATQLACARPNVVDAALHDDLAKLQREVAEAQTEGRLDRSVVEDLARAVAGREIRSARGDSAVERIHSARACLGPLSPVLRDLAGRDDDVGATATLVLADAGLLEHRPLVARYARAEAPLWRAVGARATTSRRDTRARRPLLTDPDERVRREALRAALAAADPRDLEAVLEAARLDPDPLNRGIATRAVGSIGTARAVQSLKDHWSRADQTTRMTVVDAWAMPRAYPAGGREQLIWAAESTTSLPALAAADALVRRGERDVGVGVLVRAITDGTFAERSLAVRLAPLDGPGVLEALEEAGQKGQDVRTVALARLLDDAPRRPKARARLRKLAKKKDDDGRRARAALAALGDDFVHAPLVAQIRSKSPSERKMAALSLVRLGDYSAAATALADSNPRVRLAVACRVLARARPTH